MFANRPKKQLDSRRIRNSLRVNLLKLIQGPTQGIACRAVWRVEHDDLSTARNQIFSKRLHLDDSVAAIDGVQFFLSSITQVEKRVNNVDPDEDQEDGGTTSHMIYYPAVSYFIAFCEHAACSREKMFATIHNADMEPILSEIKTRNSANIGDAEKAARKLAQVVKDHNRHSICDLVNKSNRFCRSVCGSTYDAESTQRASNYPKTPCRLVAVASSVHSVVCEAHVALVADGLVCELDILQAPNMPSNTLTAPSDITSVIRDVGLLMEKCEHALHRGYVYAKPDGAKVTFVKMMDVSSYINKLLANHSLRERILRHMHRIIQLLSHPACEMIEQIEFHAVYIEVSNGRLFQISRRSFVQEASSLPYGKISPRTYVPYDPTTPPQPLHFQDGVENSFPDIETRIRFLNKFYQCLVGRRMPLKVRKLVVSGPKDSGKTSWACVFHRLISSDRIASVTSERQFSAAMINDETELVVIDDWSLATMSQDLAKTLLQGGWLVAAVKQDKPKCVWNNSPLYITTNGVPHFGEEMENVEQRIAVFQTQSLPRTTAGIDRWIYDHAMDCVVWVANEISTHIEIISDDERWYETGINNTAVVDQSQIERYV